MSEQPTWLGEPGCPTKQPDSCKGFLTALLLNVAGCSKTCYYIHKDLDFERKIALLFCAMCLYLDCVLKFRILVVEHAETQRLLWNHFHQHQVATLEKGGIAKLKNSKKCFTQKRNNKKKEVFESLAELTKM